MKKYPLTLIEIMGVVALIVILMVIAIGAYSYASDASKEKSTTATITRLNNALASLQDKGISPLRTTGSSSTNGYVTVKFDAANKKLYFGSTEIGEDAGEAFQLFAQSMDADNIDSILDEDGYIVDGWGQRLLIRFPGKFNKGGFDIISAGSDGVFGVDDGSASETVPPVDEEKYRDSDGEIICDDVTNFL